MIEKGFDGKRVVVTGGTRGLGRAVSVQFARAGAEVLSVYIRDRKAADLLHDLANKEGLKIETIRADLSRSKGMDALVERLLDDSQMISSLVHCAATGIHRPLDELSLQHFDWTFGLNVRAFFELVQRLLPLFGEGSSIVGVSSAGASRALSKYSLVGSSKGALEALIRHMAVELAPQGIRANVLSPGALETDVWKVLPNGEERLAEAEKKSPIKRLCTLDEVAQVATFLCSEMASGIVGETIVVDGGAGICG